MKDDAVRQDGAANHYDNAAGYDVAANNGNAMSQDGGAAIRDDGVEPANGADKGGAASNGNAAGHDGGAASNGNAANYNGGADKGGGERGRETNGQRVWAVTKKLLKRWFIAAFGGMAFGLFATLIAGTIVNQIGKWIGNTGFGAAVQAAGLGAQVLMGAGIGAGVAHSLKADKLVIFSAVCAGFIGAQSAALNSAVQAAATAAPLKIADLAGFVKGPGEPVSAFIASTVAVEIGLLLQGRTKLDIVVLPLAAVLIALACAFSVCLPVARFFNLLGEWINSTTAASPVVMGIVVSVSVGLLLTLPTSSAAICVAAGIGSLAGGAAAVGGAAHMVCFAVMSWRENRVPGLIAQGLGTSMLQIPNLFKNPRVLIPPVVASAVCGPLAAAVFGLHCSPAGAGMGTAGLVGLFETVTASADAGVGAATLVPALILLFLAVPVAAGVAGRLLLGRIGWIKDGDLKLEL
ncbi:MAG: PTS sugar transporter subunit IIC [Clostridiales bacterium]|jgi:uncharacterized membrane protein|nr:PTS sugar transporter subunit IIC [Clostridiales bacterium]